MFLPPPPPYIAKSETEGLQESSSNSKIKLSANAVWICGKLPAELNLMINNIDNQFDSQQAFSQLINYEQQQFNGHILQQSSEFPITHTNNQQNSHRIHRSFSDSKSYTHNEPQRINRLLKSESRNSAIVSIMNSYGALTDHNNTGAGSSLQQSSNKIGNSDPYAVNRGSSWANSLVSL